MEIKIKNTILYFFIIILSLLISCLSPTAPNENSVSVTKLDNQLKITNNSSRTIYLVVVEQEIAALINWAPNFDGPKISKNSSMIIKYSEIYNGTEEPVKSGDKVILYYWDDSDKTTPQIFSTVVEL